MQHATFSKGSMFPTFDCCGFIISTSRFPQLLWPSSMCSPSGTRRRKRGSRCSIVTETLLASQGWQEKRFKMKQNKCKKHFDWTFPELQVWVYCLRLCGTLRCPGRCCLGRLLLFLICWFCSYKGESFWFEVAGQPFL